MGHHSFAVAQSGNTFNTHTSTNLFSLQKVSLNRIILVRIQGKALMFVHKLEISFIYNFPIVLQ